jgi:hypothetical protein
VRTTRNIGGFKGQHFIVHFGVEVGEMRLDSGHMLAEENPREISTIACQAAKIDGVVVSGTGNGGNVKLCAVELLN